jgi:Rrf2 family protein
VVLFNREGKTMKLSTKGRYGTRLLLELALHQGEGLVPLKDIAQKQEIPLQYLEHVITPLITGGIIRSVRGAGGGIMLAKAPEDIRLSDVIKLLEGPIALVDCVNNPEICDRSSSCVTRDIWCEVKESMNRVLESTTLQDLLERHRKKELSL